MHQVFDFQPLPAAGVQAIPAQVGPAGGARAQRQEMQKAAFLAEDGFQIGFRPGGLSEPYLEGITTGPAGGGVLVLEEEQAPRTEATRARRTNFMIVVWVGSN
jgi:hypothetical protein